ncbi:4-(cytidine 5'-diphospho)-2-C-methyl-D-erythritol kinase [Roseovarius sp. CAU 1744]|uniref:4-(cytidine 5'-diphospho)-2-C-methyl-D-erythritol kinase n=1 Tax=Roseovarius sp. CAU 1744 TaxID=3140368 RepID=UPI00325BB345
MTMASKAKEFAPAKVNLTLHVTGQRTDGYHLLDSLVMFADVGDRITVKPSDTPIMIIKGPMAESLPRDRSNVVAQVADAMGVSAQIQLEKNLPVAAGIGGGSSDAAATFRALSEISGKPIPEDLVAFGADVPVCMHGKAARMRGIGNDIHSVPDLPVLHAVLVNPKLPVMTAEVFKRLRDHNNAAMPDDLPNGASARELIAWLAEMRNDLQDAAIEAEPIIEHVFNTLAVTPGCLLTRMSGSGGTCFGLYGDAETAAAAAGRLHQDYPGWWVAATRLNA